MHWEKKHTTRPPQFQKDAECHVSDAAMPHEQATPARNAGRHAWPRDGPGAHQAGAAHLRHVYSDLEAKMGSVPICSI